MVTSRSATGRSRARPSGEDLETFLRRQDTAALVAVLLELAGDDETVHKRLARMQMADRPDLLAAGFRATLSGWRRSTRFRSYGEARAFARTLEGWLDQVARELLPKDPAAALALFESFIKADAAWFDQADDSDSVIGDAVRSACQYWLQAAAGCEPPRGGWAERLQKLYVDDKYGAREALLRHANLLLDEPAQRGLVALFDAELAQTIAAAPPGDNLPHQIFHLSGALSLLSESLRDPDIKVRATRRYSPDPNPLQREAFARAYLDADRPADALVWLQGNWGHLETSRQGLLAESLERLGRFEESSPIRQQLFERTLSDFDLQSWLTHLPEASRADATAHARQIAQNHDDLTAAADLLLELGDAAAAEARLVAAPDRIDGRDYIRLVPLAKALRGCASARGETTATRSLMQAILDRAYTPAYGYAARYWVHLTEIARGGISLQPLPSHEEFEQEIRARHGRKTAFWARVKERQGGGAEDEGDQTG